MGSRVWFGWLIFIFIINIIITIIDANFFFFGFFSDLSNIFPPSLSLRQITKYTRERERERERERYIDRYRYRYRYRYIINICVFIDRK